MERCVTTEHEVKTALSHKPLEAIIPHHVELLCMFQDIFSSLIGREVDSGWDRRRSVPRVLVLTAKAAKNLSVLTARCQSKGS